jgi:hypothetical protein
MSTLNDLIDVFDAYAAATGLAPSTISRRFLGATRRISDLRSGGDIGVLMADRVMAAFAASWPESHPWPAHVPRPATDTPAFSPRAYQAGFHGE